MTNELCSSTRRVAIVGNVSVVVKFDNIAPNCECHVQCAGLLKYRGVIHIVGDNVRAKGPVCDIESEESQSGSDVFTELHHCCQITAKNHPAAAGGRWLQETPDRQLGCILLLCASPRGPPGVQARPSPSPTAANICHFAPGSRHSQSRSRPQNKRDRGGLKDLGA